MLSLFAAGRLGRDPKSAPHRDGIVARFSLAVTHNKEETTWINCSVFGKKADLVMKYYKKGSIVSLSGNGKLRSYDRDGVPSQSLDLIVNDLTLPPKESSGSPYEDEQPI